MLTDDALSIVSALSGLTYLETAGISFIDIQQLAALVNPEHVYLREKTLTADTLHFVDLLTNLKWLVLKGCHSRTTSLQHSKRVYPPCR